MTTKTFDLEFITPAFLCGANQEQAELRPASVRGQLRWWLRALGADRETETRIFGGVHGEVTSSSVIIHAKVMKAVHEAFHKPAPMSDRGYLYYFATVSGERKGVRIEPNAYFAPGTAFKISIAQRRPLPEADSLLFEKATECFICLGALGLRATRGCGAFAEIAGGMDAPSFLAWAESLRSYGILVQKPVDEVYHTAQEAQTRLGGCLRNLRKEYRLSGKNRSALGYSIGTDRMASALRLRPVKIKEGFLPLLVYTDAANSQPSIRNIIE